MTVNLLRDAVSAFSDRLENIMHPEMGVRILADDGATYGYGHLSRSQEMVLAFENTGFGVEYPNPFSTPVEPRPFRYCISRA